MRPGVPLYWQVGVEAAAPDPGDIDITVAAEGDSELQLQLDFTSCSEQWVDGACAGTEAPIEFAASSLLDAGSSNCSRCPPTSSVGCSSPRRSPRVRQDRSQ